MAAGAATVVIVAMEELLVFLYHNDEETIYKNQCIPCVADTVELKMLYEIFGNR